MTSNILKFKCAYLDKNTKIRFKQSVAIKKVLNFIFPPGQYDQINQNQRGLDDFNNRLHDNVTYYVI